MKPDPKSMTDEALLQVCTLRPGESRLLSSGCWFSPVVSLLLIYGWSAHNGAEIPWFGLLLAVVALSFALTNLLYTCVSWRFRRHRRELERRYGRTVFAACIREARRALHTDKAPDWILLFQGNRSFGKTIAFVRIDLYETSPPAGRVRVHISPEFEFEFGTDPRPKMEAGEKELSVKECEQLRKRVELLQTVKLTEPLSTTSSGYPCSVALLGKRSPRIQKATCNLHGLLESEADGPTPELIRSMLGLAEQVSSHPLLVGWHDFRGSLVIGDFSLYVGEARKAMQAPDAPNWLILLKGEALPSGGARFIRIELFETERISGKIDTVVRSYASSGDGDGVPLLQREETELPLNDCEQLLSHLQTLQPRRPLNLPRFPLGVFDGFPCAIAVIRRQPFAVMRAFCNLAGVSKKHRLNPLIVLMPLVHELALKAGTSPLVVGWLDTRSSEIGIGEV